MQHEYILKYQVKELKMPEWGDCGTAVIIQDRDNQESKAFNDLLDILDCSCLDNIQNNVIIKPLNPTHTLNNKFNGLFKGCVYGKDNDIAVKVRQFEFQGKVYKVGDMVQTSSFKKNWIVRYNNKENGGWYLFDSKYTVTIGMLLYSKLIGNLLDEYLEGKNELAKLCEFNK